MNALKRRVSTLKQEIHEVTKEVLVFATTQQKQTISADDLSELVKGILALENFLDEYLDQQCSKRAQNVCLASLAAVEPYVSENLDKFGGCENDHLFSLMTVCSLGHADLLASTHLVLYGGDTSY